VIELIDSTRFGSITVDGKVYESDVIITWEWKVKEARTDVRHVVGKADLMKLLFERPDMMIIGTGQNGGMKVAEGVRKFVKEKKLKILIVPTPDAVVKFNQLAQEGVRVAAYMHVTC
jgi:hypothetical protein